VLSITTAPPAAAKLAYGRSSTLLSLAAGRRILCTALSVLTRAAPSPGKCLAVAATPPSASPRANPTPIRETVPGFRPNVRPSSEIARPGRPMSSTGARSTFSPIERRLSPVARPSPSAKTAPRAPIALAEGFGGPGSRLTRPPSWSTVINSGGLPAGRGIDWISAVSRRTEPRPPTFPSKRITPEASPASIIRRSAPGG
jgi:hypothetical protein